MVESIWAKKPTNQSMEYTIKGGAGVAAHKHKSTKRNKLDFMGETKAENDI